MFFYNEGSQEQETSIVTDGLQLYLDAGDSNSYPGTGAAWYDLSGQSNNATLLNGVAYNSQEKSMDFDGVDDQISSGLSNGALTEQYTYTIWFKFDQGTRSAGSGRKDMTYGIDFPRPHLTFDKEGDGKLGNYITKGGNNYDTVKTNTAIWNNNQWYMVTTTGNSTRDRIYVDGVLETEVSLLGTYTSWSAFNFSLNTSQGFPGQIAVALFYDRELTPTEVLQNFEATKTRFGL